MARVTSLGRLLTGPTRTRGAQKPRPGSGEHPLPFNVSNVGARVNEEELHNREERAQSHSCSSGCFSPVPSLTPSASCRSFVFSHLHVFNVTLVARSELLDKKVHIYQLEAIFPEVRRVGALNRHTSDLSLSTRVRVTGVCTCLVVPQQQT